MPFLENISGRSSLQESKKRVRGQTVGLIIPQSDFLADQRTFPFLGPLVVAGELERNHNLVEVLDLSGYSQTEEIIGEYLKESDAQIFGITATTPQFPESVRIAKTIKEANPGAQIIIGGPHATLSYTGYRQDIARGRVGRGTNCFKQVQESFDKVVVGDGEMAVFPAIDPTHREKIVLASEREDPFFLQQGETEYSSRPARHLIDMNSYHYKVDGLKAFSLIAQLGCPYECGFCSGRNTDFLRKIRTRSPQSVASEIEQVVSSSMDTGDPYRAVMFYDDELNVSPGTLESLCKELIAVQDRLGMEMRFRGFVKANLFTQEQARLMYQAGFRVLLTGVESGSDYILRAIRKKTTNSINAHCTRIAQDAGLQVKALMSIGHPGETEQTIEESVKWVLDNNPDDVDWTVITPYPGSLYYDAAEYDPEKKAWIYEAKLIDPKTHQRTKARLWSNDMDFSRNAIFYKGIPGEYSCEVFTEELSSEQLIKLREQAELETRSALRLPAIQPVEGLRYVHNTRENLPATILRRSGVKY